MKTRGFVFLLLLLLGVGAADARLQENIPMEDDSGVGITVSCCFASVTSSGFTPIDVTINNHSGATRRWDFTFSSPGYVYNGNDRTQSTFSLTVENNLTRTFPLMVPTASLDRSGGTMGRLTPIQIAVAGYGSKAAFVQIMGGHGSSGHTPTPFIVISESLGTPIWSSLLSKLQSSSLDLEGSTVKPDELPEDWRGLTGVAAMWLTIDELSHLSAAQRQAILTWVRTGGQLTLCVTTSLPPEFQNAGFGRAQTSPANNLQAGDLAYAVRTMRSPGEISVFPKPPPLDAVQPNVPLLGGFMGFFAVVVGPLNIFVLARRRRERLFWTTPLISIVASGVLGLVIVLQDGLGGHGFRIGTIHLFPDNHTAVLVQRQISRTGLLLNSTFTIPDPVWMESVQPVPGKPSTQSRNLRVTDKAFGGEWFTSRALQSQRIVAVIPTRAEITVVNQSDVAKGAAPVIVSSFDETLEGLVYSDDHDEIWQGNDIRTGQKQTLQRSTKSSGVPAPGHFKATAEHSAEYLATVSSIRWKDEVMTYTGPVTNSH